MGTLWSLQSKGQGRWEQKCENHLQFISSSNVDQFVSNQDINDHRTIHSSTYIIKYISLVEMCRFCDIFLYPGELHVAVATWPCTYMLNTCQQCSWPLIRWSVLSVRRQQITDCVACRQAWRQTPLKQDCQLPYIEFQEPTVFLQLNAQQPATFGF